MAPQDTGAAGTAGSGPAGIREAAHETIASVRQEASGLASRAKEQGKSMLAQRKDSAARQVDSVADALHGTARQLEGSEQAGTGRYVGYAADRLQALGRALRERDVDTLIRDAQDLGRRAPGAFFAGSVVAGFLIARFMKASSERGASADDAWRDVSSHGAGERRRAGDGGYDERRADRGADLRSGGPGAMPGSTGSSDVYGTPDASGVLPATGGSIPGSTATGLSGTTPPSGDRHDR